MSISSVLWCVSFFSILLLHNKMYVSYSKWRTHKKFSENTQMLNSNLTKNNYEKKKKNRSSTGTRRCIRFFDLWIPTWSRFFNCRNLRRFSTNHKVLNKQQQTNTNAHHNTHPKTTPSPRELRTLHLPHREHYNTPTPTNDSSPDNTAEYRQAANNSRATASWPAAGDTVHRLKTATSTHTNHWRSLKSRRHHSKRYLCVRPPTHDLTPPLTYCR